MATKTVVEEYSLYGGEVKMNFYPNSHMYKIDGDRKLGVTGITGIINKEALMLWPMEEALGYLKKVLHEDDENQGVLWSYNELAALLETARTQYQKKQLRGTDAGTKAHDYLEQYLKYINGQVKTLEETLVITPESNLANMDENSDEYIRARDENNLCTALDSFKSWYKENDVKVIHLEKIVYSRKYDYCGKFDAILQINGKNYLVDFKTSNPSREFGLGIYPENFSQLGGYDVAFTEEFPDFQIDGHGIINLSKKTGKLAIKMLEGQEERKKNRDFFIFTLGVKRGMQDRTRLLSNKYGDKR